MSPEAKAKVSEMVSACGVVYGKEVTEILVKTFWMMLDGYSVEDLKRAFMIHLESSKFFPTPAHILANLREGEDELASRALSKLQRAIVSVGRYQSIAFMDDPLIGHVVHELGGWPKVCQMEERDLRFSFTNLYKGRASRREKLAPVTNPGVHELENASRGIKGIPQTALIGTTGEPVKQLEA